MDAQLRPISPYKTPEPSVSTDSLIREWLFRFGVEHKEDVAPKLPLWLETFGGMDAATLEPLFRKAMRSCKFFPKVCEILEPLQAVKEAALPEEASEAWQLVLSIRREHFNPDFPRHLARAVAALPERIQRAARAAGVFQDFSDIDQLYVWAKKRFIESYLAWEQLEEDKFLLPEGKIKNLLAEVAVTKALPAAAAVLPQSLPYKPAIAAEREGMQSTQDAPTKPVRHFTPQPMLRSIEDQKRILREKGFLPGAGEGRA